MKKIASIFIIITILFSCGNKSKVNNQLITEKTNSETSKIITNGYLMKVKIDGKPWQSTSMAPVEASGRIVGYYNGQYIGLPYNKSYLIVGKKIIINQDEAADIFLKDGCSYPLTNGLMEITKIGDNWAEGTFYFTTVCSSTNKTVKITDGFFRIQASKN